MRAAGLPTTGIAARLEISTITTADRHIQSISNTTDAGGRAAAARSAVQNGLAAGH